MEVKYGDVIRLHTVSAYARKMDVGESTSSSVLRKAKQGGYLGYYAKNGRHGVLTSIPPLGPKLDEMFHEEQYTVLDPHSRHTPGTPVHYGETLALVNQHGLVWNNKTGGITGYIGPRPRKMNGEMFVSFQKNSKKPSGEGGIPNVTSATTKEIAVKDTMDSMKIESKSSLPLSSSSVKGNAVKYGDTNITIEVEESHRHMSRFNKSLTNFKKSTSNTIGGYICSDGKGHSITFTVHPIEPQISRVMIGEIPSGARYGDSIQLEEDSSEKIVIEFNNGGYLHIDLKEDLCNSSAHPWEPSLPPSSNGNKKRNSFVRLDKQSKSVLEKTVFLPLTNAPGGLILKYQKEKLATQSDVTRNSSLPSSGNLVQGLTSPKIISSYLLISAVFLAVLSSMEIVGDGTVMLMAVVLWSPSIAIIAYGKGNPEVEEVELSSHATGNDGSCTILVLCKWSLDCSILVGDSKNIEKNSNKAVVKGDEDETDIPLRFIKATKGDMDAARARWEKTCAWREEEGIDSILSEPQPHFEVIKQNYAHFFHKRGKKNEPVYYEKPGKIDLKKMKESGITIDILLRYYIFLTEFLWTKIEPSEEGKSITVIDIDGIGMRDAFGEPVAFVKKAAAFVSEHYPERASAIYVLNVPSWWNMIWKVVKQFVDDVTTEKICFASGKANIREALLKRIDLENIPVEYGGSSVGNSPEEELMIALCAFNNGKGPDPFSKEVSKPPTIAESMEMKCSPSSETFLPSPSSGSGSSSGSSAE